MHSEVRTSLTKHMRKVTKRDTAICKADKDGKVLIRGGQLLQSAGQIWENEVFGGPDYYINSIHYLNHIFIH